MNEPVIKKHRKSKIFSGNISGGINDIGYNACENHVRWQAV